MLELQNVNRHNKYIYINLVQAYEAEFSPITHKLSDEKGLYPLDTCLKQNRGFLFYDEEQLIGLAALSEDEALKKYEMLEFYIIPTHRKKNFGEQFAHMLFQEFLGEWQIKQISGAEYATYFWQKVISSYEVTDYQTDHYHDTYWGHVTRQKFSTVKI